MSEASPRGTYLVISEALRKGIEEGEIVDDLPSEADLVRTHGVARNTIRRALGVPKPKVSLSPPLGWGGGSLGVVTGARSWIA